jgi:hypothetical protein
MHLDADVVREIYATQPALRRSASTLVTRRIVLKQDEGVRYYKAPEPGD